MADEWLTYAQAAERLGISTEALRALARRRGWPRQRPNRIGEAARVQLPNGLDRRAQPPVTAGVPDGHPLPSTRAHPSTRAQEAHGAAAVPLDQGDDHTAGATAETFRGALVAIWEQLKREQTRADRAEALFHDEHQELKTARRRIDELLSALADVTSAERVARNEAAALRSEHDRRQACGLLKRLGWAFRPR